MKPTFYPNLPPRRILPVPPKPSGLRAAAIGAMVLAAAPWTVWAAPAKGGQYGTEAEARVAGPDFDVQGEYVGTVGGAGAIGIQVIALGNSEFQAVYYPGGLPGAGWDGKGKSLGQGRLTNGNLMLAPADGSRAYMAGPPSEFSATGQFPPAGHQAYTAMIRDGRLKGRTDSGAEIRAEKMQRRSPTLGKPPPAGAVVLLPFEPGTPPVVDAWTNPKWAPRQDGSLQAVPKCGENRTREVIAGSWLMHVEFRSPFQPDARSQGRGNSGVFPPGGREIQVLDSFGLDGLPNECGGIYKNIPPQVNMCLPPLSWQTYDITFHAAEGDEPAWYHVEHNGVTIHEKVPLGKPGPGPLRIQDHGNPVSYRNIWYLPAGR